MEGIVLAVLTVVQRSIPLIETMVELGRDVAPFVGALRNSLDEIGDPTVVNTVAFQEAQALIKPFEDRIQAAAAAARLEPEA